MMKKFTPGTLIQPRQWVCLESKRRDAICQEPQQVIRIDGNRVVFRNKHGEEAYATLPTIAYVCDTKEEGQHVFTISESQHIAVNAVRQRHGAMLEKIITDSVPA